MKFGLRLKEAEFNLRGRSASEGWLAVGLRLQRRHSPMEDSPSLGNPELSLSFRAFEEVWRPDA